MKNKICGNTEAALKAVQRGEIVIVIDDEKRENEGDFIVAAEKISPESVNFLTKYGRGLLCVAMERNDLQRLGLSRMNTDGTGDVYQTAFMESVDAREGVTTGISAHDRARTVNVLIDAESSPSDIMRPGHVFPLEAVAQGVLRRPGHTEAAVDLARLAGCKPAGVICEILCEDGQMARQQDLEAIAKEHGLQMIAIQDIVEYRKSHEKLVVLEKTAKMPTVAGVFDLKIYHAIPENENHIALVMGEPEKQKNPLIRVHSECLTGDVMGSLRCDCGLQLRASMERIAEEGHGIVLYLRQEGRGIGLAHKIHAYALQDEGMDTVEANESLGFDADLRDYYSAAQILQDLGITACRLLTNNPAKIEGLEKMGLRVQREPLKMESSEYNERYLATKKSKLGHLL